MWTIFPVTTWSIEAHKNKQNTQFLDYHFGYLLLYVSLFGHTESTHQCYTARPVYLLIGITTFTFDGIAACLKENTALTSLTLEVSPFPFICRAN